jgi:aliphatic sulfonates family ABC transporter substrate-binding protein
VKLLRPALLLAVATLFLAACAPAATPTQAPPAQSPAAQPTAAPQPTPTPLQPIKIGITTGIDPVYGAFYVADKQGIFKKNGLDATVTKFDRGGEGLNAVIAGQQDVASTAESTFILPIDKGADFYVVAVTCQAPQTIKFVVRSDVQGPQDLKGKTIGIALGSVSEYVWDRFFETFGMSRNDVKIVNVAPPETVALMDKGDIDAFALWEPWPSRALEAMGNKAKILFPSSEKGMYAATLYMQIRKEFADKNPDGVKRLLKALIEANTWMKQNPDEAKAIIAEATKLKPQDVDKMWKEGFKYDIYMDDAAIKNVDSIAKWLKDKGQIKAVPDWKKYFKLDFLKEVDPNAVKVTSL